MEEGDEPTIDREEVTLLLKRVGDDSEGAREELLGLVYGTLRRIAQNRMRWERRSLCVHQNKMLSFKGTQLESPPRNLSNHFMNLSKISRFV